jgi:6-phosphogluconolactonase
MRRLVFPTSDALYDFAAADFTRRSQSSIHERGTFHVLLCGGETPIPLYRRLASEPWRSRIEWDRVIIGWSDERCVPENHPASNYGRVRAALFSHLPIPPKHVLRIRGEEDPKVEAAAYARRLKAAMNHDVPDLALLGMGADGHTASLFPGHPALFEDREWYVPVHVPSLDPAWRVTATYPLLNACRQALFLVTGTSKADALARARSGALSPATLVRPEHGDVIWLVDRSAQQQV